MYSVALLAHIRWFTAIAVIGICGFSIAQGFRIVHFSLATVNIDSSEQRAEIINAWSSAPDVASTALQAALKDKINVSDPAAANSRREALASILSIKPLSSVDWLSLSKMQLVTDQPMEQVSRSLELSMLTGPNEGYVTVERGIFGVSVWEDLSPYLRKLVATDLATGEINDEKIQQFQAVLFTKPQRVRKELREALLASGLSLKEIEQRLRF